jgi:hypothetical protein
MPLYRRILSQAWRIAWRHKYLWFFGLFAVLFTSGGEYEIFIRIFSGNINQPVLPGLSRIAETGIFSQQGMGGISRIIKEDPITLMKVGLVLLVILVLFIFLIWLSVISQTALVKNVSSLVGKKIASSKAGAVSPGAISSNFSVSILKANEKFWPIFGLNVINKIVIYLAFILVSLPIILTAGGSGAVIKLLYIVAFIIFVPVALALSFIFKYAIAYVIIKGNKFIDSIMAGWLLFVKNWLISLEMAFILFFVNFIAGLLIILIVLSLIIPFLFLALVVYQLATTIGFWIIITLAFIVLLAVIVLSGAILSTFQISSWTTLFIELVNKGGVSKIIRIAEAVKERITDKTDFSA